MFARAYVNARIHILVLCCVQLRGEQIESLQAAYKSLGMHDSKRDLEAVKTEDEVTEHHAFVCVYISTYFFECVDGLRKCC